MMNTDIETLLTNTILQGRNPDSWRVDYVISNVNRMFSRLAQESRKKKLDADELTDALSRAQLHFRRSDCWVPSGNEAIRVDIETDNLFVSLFFDKTYVTMLMDIKCFFMTRKEYEASFIDANLFVSRLIQIETCLSDDIEEWPAIVHGCVKRVKMIRMRESAAIGYMNGLVAGTPLTYSVRTTSECIVVALTAKGECELSTSITEGDDIMAKLDFLMDEMKRKI